jgi:branched-chain amino acid aminotransferase
MAYVWVNNRFVAEDDAAVSVRDTGLLHAAGAFTTMRSFGGRVFRLAAHLNRLRGSCEALDLPLGYSDHELTDATVELLHRNRLVDARLRLTVTRGAAGTDRSSGGDLVPSVILTAAPVQPYPAELYETGMTVVLVDDQKLNPYDMQAGHKTLNYHSKLTALRSANRRQAGEALWFNVHNYLQSGSVTNVLLVRDGALVTPPTQREMDDDPALAAAVPYSRSNVLPGTTRQVLLELARRMQIPVRLGAVDVNELRAADEVMVSNSSMGAMPVCSVERHVVGTGRPGEITRRLVAALAAQIAAECGGR